MPVTTAGAVRKQIKAGTPDPLYLLLGDDEVEKSALAAEFAGLVEEGLQAFNVERIHLPPISAPARRWSASAAEPSP